LYLIKKHSATTTPITTTTTRDDDDERVYFFFFSSSSSRSLGEDARKVHRDQSDGGETQEEQKARSRADEARHFENEQISFFFFFFFFFSGEQIHEPRGEGDGERADVDNSVSGFAGWWIFE